MSPTSLFCRETRKDRRRAGRARAPAAPGSPSCSCRAACRCGQPPATPAHPREPGSPSCQCRNDGGRQSWRYCRRDPGADIARKFDLDRRHQRRRGHAIAGWGHHHPSKAIGRSSQIPPPTVDQTRCYVRLACHVPHHCARRKRRRDDRLLLLAAPPPPPLGTGQCLNARHCTRLLHRSLPARSTHRSQDGPRRTVTLQQLLDQFVPDCQCHDP
jgi:hypothetical protein